MAFPENLPQQPGSQPAKELTRRRLLTLILMALACLLPNFTWPAAAPDQQLTANSRPLFFLPPISTLKEI